MATRTDNHDPRAKLELRRYFLRRYHAIGPIDVLDCCQGSGLLWTALQKEFTLTSYWGLDLKAKKGRLKLDSVRVLAQPGWPQNVVDIDTYGSPWAHWAAMLPNIARPTTVFLTWGKGGPLQDEISNYEIQSLGIPPSIKKRCKSIGLGLKKILLSYLLTRSCGYAKITEAVEAVSHGNARYMGLRLEPET